MPGSSSAASSVRASASSLPRSPQPTKTMTSASAHLTICCSSTVLPVPNPPGTAAVAPLATGNSRSTTRWPVARGIDGANNGTVDIGAFESQGFTLTAVSGNNQDTPLNGSGPPAGGGGDRQQPGGASDGRCFDFHRPRRQPQADHQPAGPGLRPPHPAAASLPVRVASRSAPPVSLCKRLDSLPVPEQPSRDSGDHCRPGRCQRGHAGDPRHGLRPVGKQQRHDHRCDRPINSVTVDGITVNSSTQITLTVSGTLADGDVLSAIVTTDGSSAPTTVAVVGRS